MGCVAFPCVCVCVCVNATCRPFARVLCNLILGGFGSPKFIFQNLFASLHMWRGVACEPTSSTWDGARQIQRNQANSTIALAFYCVQLALLGTEGVRVPVLDAVDDLGGVSRQKGAWHVRPARVCRAVMRRVLRGTARDVGPCRHVQLYNDATQTWTQSIVQTTRCADSAPTPHGPAGWARMPASSMYERPPWPVLALTPAYWRQRTDAGVLACGRSAVCGYVVSTCCTAAHLKRPGRVAPPPT